MDDTNCTLALQDLAGSRANHPAVIRAEGAGGRMTWTFRELEERSARCAAGLRSAGLLQSERVLILARPDEHFIPFLFGLLRAGGVAVFIDPGRPLKELLNCVREAQPSVLLAPPLLQAASALLPGLPIRLRIVPSAGFPGAVSLTHLAQTPAPLTFEPAPGGASEAVVIFTTGSTGMPKGVIYSHNALQNQLQAVISSLQIGQDEVGLFGHSAMMLIGLMAGATAFVSPELDRSPSSVDVARFAELLNESSATVTFASPALCQRLVAYCAPRGIVFSKLRKLVVGGAEMNRERIQALERLLPGGDVVISLGSTEVMPVATIPGRDAVARMSAEGHASPGAAGAACVGFPAADHELRIIPIRDQAIPAWSDELALPAGVVGEIVISGPGVTAQYLNRPEQTRLAKIRDGDRFWHRMGDLGSLDADGCLWLYGRKSQRVETGAGALYTIPCESVFNRHPGVERCALVGLGNQGDQTAVIVLELHPESYARTPRGRTQLATELVGMAKSHPHTEAIRSFAFYPRPFPVDIRHNSKIGREKLAAWAARTSDLLRAED